MTTFINFRDAIQRQFEYMAQHGDLFESAVDKDGLYNTYLYRFEEGTNPLFRERTVHDCQCCKSFIRNVGRVLSIIDGKLVSVWDVNVGGIYQPVADGLAEVTKAAGIGGLYLNDTQEVGRKENYEEMEDGHVHTWSHFHAVLPEKAYLRNGDSIAEKKGNYLTSRKTLKRSIEEISTDAVEQVYDLCKDNAIVRGDQQLPIVQSLKTMQQEYAQAQDKDLYLWQKALTLVNKGLLCNIRGSSIGTLLVALTEGEDLTKAVHTYETSVAGAGYKRTTALVTPAMQKAAELTAEKLGIKPSLPRRHANKHDINVVDVLFADHTVAPYMEGSVFDGLASTAKRKAPDFNKVGEVSYKTFVEDLLPKADSVELFVEGSYENKFMTLTVPENATAPALFKWDNNAAWSYNGDVALSAIAQNVKKAGGVVDAPFRISLDWHNHDDLDLHMHGNHGHIYFVRKHDICGGELDVDMCGERRDQVENIFWNHPEHMPVGTYQVYVHNFRKNARRYEDVEGFTVEIEIFGEVTTINYPKMLGNNKSVSVAEVTKGRNGLITLKPEEALTGYNTTKTIWGIETGDFRKVDMVMKSPNYWDNANKAGTEHLFFILADCKNPEPVRGFFNEYLREELQPHRKTFEVLGDKLKAPYQDDQLSGVGFAITQHGSAVVRLKGEVTRVVKVVF